MAVPAAIDNGRPRLGPFVGYFLRLGTLGFGGPIALAGRMQDELVTERHWIDPQEYKEGLALAQLAPGPLAAQLAMYLGWVRFGALGATLVAAAFIGPSFMMVLVLSACYVRFGGLPWMQSLFYGIGGVVIAIIARSVVRLSKVTIGRDTLLWVLFALNAAVTIATESEVVWVLIASGIVYLLARRRAPVPALHGLAVAPRLSLTGALAVATGGVVWRLFTYFATAGLFVFGSGLAIVPFLYGGVVRRFHWLSERQFVDAVAVSMITPGPVVITVAFIGYLVAGPSGATAAALGVFLPVYLIVLVVAPRFHRLVQNPRLKAFVDGVTAATTGAIAGAAVILGRRSLVDLPAILIALGAFVVLTRVKRVPEPVLIVVAGIVGLLVRGAG